MELREEGKRNGLTVEKQLDLDLCEHCRPKVKAWLIWMEGRLRDVGEPTPELDPTYLDGLGWKSFVSGGGEWIVRDALGAKALSDELDRRGGALTIGNHQYKVTVNRSLRCEHIGCNSLPV